MERVTKLILLCWAAAALAFELRLLSGSWPALAAWMLVITLGTAVWSAVSRHAVTVVLVFAYAVPVLARTMRGGAPYAPNETIWLAPLFGVMLPDLLRTPWRLPVSWRIPLVAAALAVAATAPIVVLREVDFIPGLLLEREAWHWTGTTWPSLTAAWVLYVSLAIVLGILWFDWLLGRSTDRFVTDVVTPLIASATLLVGVVIYQFFFDLRFLNQTVYASHGRATGTMYDANLAGMVAAMWIGGVAVWAERPGWPRVPVAVGAAVAAWAAVWATASRTSLAAAAIISGFAVLAYARSVRVRFVHVAAAGAVVVLLATLIASGSGQTVGPIARIQRTLPSASVPSMRAFVQELWNRNSYGRAATVAVRQYPWFGVGIGTFHLLASSLAGLGTLPPDNAQNWLRHQLAELGMTGSAGFFAWFLIFATFIGRQWSGAPPGARVLGGVLAAFGAVSMLGVPGQDAIIVITFWTCAAWFVHLVGLPRVRPVSAWWSAVVALLTVAAVVGTTMTATTRLRPAHRAMSADWSYSYGLSAPQANGADAGFRLGSQRAVAVIERMGTWMVVTVRLREGFTATPVMVRVRVNGAPVLKGQLTTTSPLRGAVDLSEAEQRVLLEADADEAGILPMSALAGPREAYVITWEFVARRPDPSRL